MGKKDRHLVGLDIGSTKTCVLIGELADDLVKFIAMGAAESKGLRKGLIVNLDAAVSSIRRAVEEAEGVAGIPIESALVGVAGSHIRGINSRGGITLGSRPRDIQREDVRRAVDAARSVSLPEDREVLHVLPQEFLLDAQDNIRDPIGMVGQRLEVNVHLVTASAAAMPERRAQKKMPKFTIMDQVPPRTMRPTTFPDRMPVPGLRGRRCMRAGSWGSTASARAGSPSVARFT